MLQRLLSYIGFWRADRKPAEVVVVEEVVNANEVYCQSCGQDITFRGGDVSSTGRIYCHGYKPDDSKCLDAEFFVQMSQGTLTEDMVIFNYHDVKQVQRDIKKRRLKQFGPLKKQLNIPL